MRNGVARTPSRARTGPPGKRWTSPRVATVTRNRTKIDCPVRRIRKPTTVSVSFLALAAATPGFAGGGRGQVTRWLLGEVPVLGQGGRERVEAHVRQLAADRL